MYGKSDVDGASKSKSKRFLDGFAVQIKLEKVFKSQENDDENLEFKPKKPNFKKIMLITISQISSNFIVIKKKVEQSEIDESIIIFVEVIYYSLDLRFRK